MICVFGMQGTIEKISNILIGHEIRKLKYFCLQIIVYKKKLH